MNETLTEKDEDVPADPIPPPAEFEAWC